MANDININESAILEALNAKIDYDGGNYKGSGLANYVVDKTGDTMTGQLKFKTTSIDTAVAPSAPKHCFSDYVDTNNIRIGVIGATQHTNGVFGTYMQAGNVGQCRLVTDGTNVYFDFPKCTTKATTTSSARSDKVAVIVKNYVNGTSWYRVWSDGWKEQGGFAASTGGTITLLQKMSNNTYTCICVHNGNGAKGEGFIHAYNKTTTAFSYGLSVNTNGMYGISWYVCGY